MIFLHTLPSEIMKSCSDGFLYCFAEWALTVTSGAFWIFALLAFSFAIFMATMRYGSTRAFGFGSFVGMIGGIWFAVLQLMSWWIASAFILVGIIGLAMMVLSEK